MYEYEAYEYGGHMNIYTKRPALSPDHQKTKGEPNKKQAKTNLLDFPKKTRVVCNPDLGPAVVLGAPRSAFLADFQPPGASRSPPGLKLKNSIKHPQKHLYIYIYICMLVWIPSKKWFPRLSLLK
jgi:hypothetical protein